ncbi:MAG: type I-MYXAN CRISPR-associated protein Cas6/Cmx6 [Gammaproteobacteria bacterium]|nr:type I-MYXAN CRISPR-associated protein Cas6/Cmx6 [Gammaproteobacteria bacterium]
MFWDEDDNKGPYQVPEDVVDVGFKVISKALPLEHAHELYTALQGVLPWLKDEALIGIHQIHGAESGNGWTRPEDSDNELLHLSRRARFYIRTPAHRLDEIKALTGQILDIDGHRLELGSSIIKPLSTQSEQFSRYVIVEQDEEQEADFLKRVVTELNQLLETKIRKIMCGKPHTIRLPDEIISTRSIMVADLDPEIAVKLQQQGVGRGRQYGCGLFLPHKGIKAVGETEDKTHFTGAR